MKYIIDDFSEEQLMKIIRKFVRHIYGKDLTMIEDSSGYLSSGYIEFFSVGPVPPYHRNLAGRLWVNDDRLINIIMDFFSTDYDQALGLVGFYFSNKYDIKIMDAKVPSHVFFGKIDYSRFDDENYHIEDDED